MGDLDRTRAMLEEMNQSLPHQHEWMKWRYTQHLTHSLGELLFTQGEFNRALTLADECLTLAEKTESRKNIIKGRRLRGQVFLAQNKLPEAENEFLKAQEIAIEIGNPPQLWKTYVALGDLRMAQKDHDTALEAHRNAMTIIKEVANGLEDPLLKQTFLHSEHVQSIREKAQM